MINFFLRSTAFRILLVGCFFQLVFADRTNGREKQSLVTNVRHTKTDSSISIKYDLSGVLSSNYHVTLVLLSKDDNSFRYTPKKLTGDIGDEIYAGESKTITWDTKSEFPDGLTSSAYYFSVQAEEDTSSSISPWVWVGGAVVVGGAVLLLSKKTQDEVPNVFPAPPGRP